jgi:UDP-3-O-[3-hydroxymyristoyl] N-acetylglucosamine deacetylase
MGTGRTGDAIEVFSSDQVKSLFDFTPGRLKSEMALRAVAGATADFGGSCPIISGVCSQIGGRLLQINHTLILHLPSNLALAVLPRDGVVLAAAAHMEQTVAESLEFTGVGLHSGAPVTMRLLPAPAGSGIVFRRTDLDDFEIPAIGRNVAKVSYATSLMRQGVLISTTEHLLSALIGMGIDNVIVALDNLELPILDGSALPYVEAILATGIRTQRRQRESMRILKPVEVREGNKFIGVYPGKGYGIEYIIDFPAPIGRQEASIDLAAEMYGSQIAPARTFGYKADEKKLKEMGLIRGASPENAIIMGPNGPENGPLRFQDEFVRHKVLDLIGDLALAGRRIEGHVVAERAGHAMHTALVSRLLKDRSAWELARVSPAEAEAEPKKAASILGQPAFLGA